MLIREFFTPGLAIYSYLVFDEETKKGVVIDPTRLIEPYLAFAAKEQIQISDILETHVHADFLSGAPELKAAVGGRPLIHCSAMGGVHWIPSYADRPVYDRDQLKIGEFRLEAWHTPGHTEEHLMWLLYDEKRNLTLPELAFTGDLLLVGSVGRPDLLGQEKLELLLKELYHTLFYRLQTLPDFLEIFPGHGAGSLCGKNIGTKKESTWGYEKQSNPYLKPQEFEKWKTCLLENFPKAPDYFSRMKQLNLDARQLKPFEPLTQMMIEEETSFSESRALLLDTRPTDAFAALHYKGSLNLPINSPHFTLWAGIFLQPNQKTFVLLNRLEDLLLVENGLKLIGMEKIEGFALFSNYILVETAQQASSPQLDVSYLHQNREKFYILDVRSPFEWQQMHLCGAHHLELTTLPHSLKTFPSSEPIALMCRSGTRAGVAASYLMSCGFEQVSVVKGGMLAWQQAGYPIIFA